MMKIAGVLRALTLYSGLTQLVARVVWDYQADFRAITLAKSNKFMSVAILNCDIKIENIMPNLASRLQRQDGMRVYHNFILLRYKMMYSCQTVTIYIICIKALETTIALPLSILNTGALERNREGEIIPPL